MLRHWVRKIKQLLDEKEQITEEEQERRTYHYSTEQSNAHARVMYNYPRKGKFRFPVIEDEERKQSETVDQKEPFVPYEARETPTPKNDYKWTITPSPVYGYKEQQKSVEQNKMEPNIENIELEHTEQRIETNDLLSRKREKRVESIATKQEPVKREKMNESADDFVHEGIAVKEESTVDHEQVKDELTLAAGRMGDEGSSSNRQERMRRKLERQKVAKTNQEQEEQTVPYNVMMLPKDRVSNNKVEEKESKEEGTTTYTFPSIQLLRFPEKKQTDNQDWLHQQASILEETLHSFNVEAKVVHVTQGPSVTRFEIQPGKGVKVTKVTGLNDDMKLALSAKDIRIEAPIPGKNTIGIEVPNQQSAPVFLRELLRRDLFIRESSPLTVALGLDISGQPIMTDLQKMPHGLVAGATGSGKSVCINSILISLLYKATPDEVKLMLIDPKMVELAPYNELPHLVTPVITDAKQATIALKWVVEEMERRYELFSQYGVRDVKRYNDLYSESADKPALPYMLVVIDELADLMMVSPQDVEDSICRIAQKARACGIHLLLATQRPSVDVITGLIKANIPTRIAFSVSSQTDSRTILDSGGAERLLGRGDMLFYENGSPKSIRVQGTFVSDEEIEEVVSFVKKQRQPEYLLEQEQLMKVAKTDDVDDELFEEACHYVVEQGGASASSLQRRYRIGYNRAARLIDMMEDAGIISEAMGSKPRHILVDSIQLEEVLYHEST
ncbi:DNA translocase FtsK [Halalkalibacter hemicellulosilyticus]|uniref:Cell division protein FtsK n=1 Tax=Halalkalibacter hemicellulosilyticusJCM 9152 TaxID=1236971 RepID=W4QJX2_9BACI|nr:DNA translocase FtsK [Halalkalibacter hemicellulosilyticus]GAE32386.1 cell division protein FtsK [Halalkalibacter hemicellulosilyticusJCM 9152]